MGEKIYLGTIEDAEGIGLFDVPLKGSVEEIREAIERANSEREAEKQRESAAIKAMFLPAETKVEDKPAPIRDWLRP